MADYLLAQYYRDPIRREPKNVGVFVINDGKCAGKFLGETAGGDVDLRTTRWARDPRIYRKWVLYWREELAHGAGRLRERLMEDQGGNFGVIIGGKAGIDYGTEANEICANLFPRLVSITVEDEGGEDESESEGMPIREMYREITGEFKERGLLAGDVHNPIPHPIFAKADAVGKSTPHKPSYQQRSGDLFVVMENVNFNTPRKGPAKDHAMWAAKMFDDIRAHDSNASGIAIIRASTEDLKNKTVQYALALIKDSAREVVNKLDPHRWKGFLNDREAIGFGSAV